MGIVDILPSKLVLSPEANYGVAAVQETWCHNVFGYYPLADFEIGWTGNYSLLLWATMSGGDPSFRNSTQVSVTSPLILAPFKQHTITLSMMKYMLGNLWFISYRPGTWFTFPSYH